MLDIRFIRENPELVKEKSKQKGYDVDVDALLKLDNNKRELVGQVDGLRTRRNEIANSTKNGQPEQALIDEGKQIKVQLAEREELLSKTESEFNALLNQVPNPAFDDVPVGGEKDSAEVSKFGSQDTGALDHLDLAEKRDWVDFERGAKVASSKFYFLKNDLARLEMALIQFGLDYLSEKGFSFFTVPHMVNSKTAEGAGFAPKNSESGNEYFIEGEDLSLIGTSEAPLTGYHAGETLNESDLPLMYVGYSPCYRRESGTYGKHTRGLFRVHQFNKLEMYVFCLPEQSTDVHEKLRAIEEEIWQKLGIPYRIVNIASGDLGAPAAKKYDLEYWSKVDGAYRELTSCSNCTDYQTRSLNIKVKKGDGSTVYAHSLNGTAISTARSLVAIIEHYQTEKDQVKIPEVLKKYMGDKETI